MLYLQLFWEFFKTGLFAIGGGMATIPFLYNMAEETSWFTRNDLANMIAVSESTPGPIGVNMATYVGFVSGMNDDGIATALLGAVTATMGLIIPSIIIIVIVAVVLKSFRDNKLVNYAFYGLRPASTGLIAAAGISVAASSLVTVGSVAENTVFLNWKGLALGAVLWLLTNIVKKTKSLHPTVFIGISAVAGIVFSM